MLEQPAFVVEAIQFCEQIRLEVEAADAAEQNRQAASKAGRQR